MTSSFSNKVLQWFDINGRKHLPWQQDINAYRVWISEIMLQQTQVATVIPYYEKFMQSFPKVADLAQAELDDVLHHWSGLGYYTRAKNLHRAAVMVVQVFEGEFPQTVDEMISLPGIGRSTAGAIISIAFKKRAAILDGNVKRVLARYHAIPGWPGKTSVLNQLWEKAEEHTPSKRVNDYTQAMMDMGATVCTRTKPNCLLCPLKETCQALDQHQIDEIPGKKPKKVLPVKQTRMIVIHHGDDILLNKRPLVGIWPGLWSFAELALDEDIDQFIRRQYQLKQYERESLAGFRHTFSHYHLDIDIEHIITQEKPKMVMEEGQQLWYNKLLPPTIGLAAPVTKILKKIV